MSMKIIGFTLAAIGLVTYGLMSLNQIEAYQGDFSKVGPYHTVEREVAMDKIMLTDDYEGWKKLITENGRTPGVLRKIDTEAKFLKFAEAHRLQDSGKTSEAGLIRSELGMGEVQARGQGGCNK